MDFYHLFLKGLSKQFDLFSNWKNKIKVSGFCYAIITKNHFIFFPREDGPGPYFFEIEKIKMIFESMKLIDFCSDELVDRNQNWTFKKKNNGLEIKLEYRSRMTGYTHYSTYFLSHEDILNIQIKFLEVK